MPGIAEEPQAAVEQVDTFDRPDAKPTPATDTDLAATRRLILRSTKFSRTAPNPPRGIRYDSTLSLLSWDSPVGEDIVTHYRVYADNDQKLVRQVPVGQRFLQDNLVASRIFISAYNETVDLESTRIPLQQAIAPPQPSISTFAFHRFIQVTDDLFGTKWTVAAGLTNIVVASNVATATIPAHGLANGDKITISGSTTATGLNGKDCTVGSVATNTFTFPTTGVADGTYNDAGILVQTLDDTAANALGAEWGLIWYDSGNRKFRISTSVSGGKRVWQDLLQATVNNEASMVLTPDGSHNATPDLSLAVIFEITLSVANVVHIKNPLNSYGQGQKIIFRLIQDGTGHGKVDWDTKYKGLNGYDGFGDALAYGVAEFRQQADNNLYLFGVTTSSIG